ncbi:hypothetical protein PHMEG_00032992 [Phytophthora megakarya]|uniref:Uncharacterized protein n=1 Tax=Phytophthora megakarya TaxID=4795 RepID=A0A225UUF5_9STRA|nr:hypothetical protein PHMEG_00032992 [Phytophthora megakarya]
MKHPAPTSHSASFALDAYDFDDASVATQEIVDACKCRNCHTRENGGRQQRSNQRVMTTDTFRCSDVKTQDPTAFANLLADHFVAREAAASVTPRKAQQWARPVAGAVGLGSFRSWQFGERCLATYRVLFGRPLWGATMPTSVPLTSPRPRKRKHVTPMDEDSVELGGTEMLSLPTVDELLELPTEDPFGFDMKETVPLEEDVLAGLAIDLDEELEDDMVGDGMDLLWDLEVEESAMVTEGHEGMRFLPTSPSALSPVSLNGEDMEDI